MTNRTIQFNGQGFGTSPVTVTVTVSGNLVYTGPVPTINQILPDLWYDPALYVNLFTIQLPVEFNGNVPMTVAVTSGYGILLSSVHANYIPVPNPIYTPEQFAIVTNPAAGQEGLDIVVSLANPPFTQEEISILSNPPIPDSEYRALLAAHNVSIYVSGGDQVFGPDFWQDDCRTNVSLNNKPVSPPLPRPSGLIGDWTWAVPDNNTLAFTFNTDAGLL